MAHAGHSSPSHSHIADPESVHPFDVGWRERIAVLGSLGLLLLTLLLLGQRYRLEQITELTKLVPMTFFAVGKFLPLWGITDQSSMGPYELGAVIWALDTFTVVVFVYSFEAFYKLGPLQRGLDRLYKNMSLVLIGYPSIKRASVVGVLLFVLFPISGTGALAGSVIGLLLGMNRFVLMATVSAGGCFGGLLMAFLASNFGNALSSFEAVQNNPGSKYWILAILAGLIVMGLFFVNRAFRRSLAAAQETERLG